MNDVSIGTIARDSIAAVGGPRRGPVVPQPRRGRAPLTEMAEAFAAGLGFRWDWTLDAVCRRAIEAIRHNGAPS